ncbi:MAG TPA: FAD-dependent oxidoreductase [Syntrophorhabdaceae bacterium]
MHSDDEKKKPGKAISRRQFIAAGVAGSVVAAGLSLTNSSEAAPMPKKWDGEADVVIAGFGGAGACAAIEAAKAGATVILLEKEQIGGGSTTLSGGAVYAAGTPLQKSLGIEDSADDMFKYLKACGHGRADDALIRITSDRSAQNVAWLESLGVEFPKDLLYTSGMEEEPEYKAVTPAKKRGHRAKGTGGAVYKALANEVAKQKNVKVMTATQAVQLITKPGATAACGEIVGVKVRQRGKELNIRAKKAVILTTGGIMATDMARPWLLDYSPSIAKCVPAGARGATGDGYRMGISQGAALGALNSGGILPAVLFPGQTMAGIVYINIWGLPNIYVDPKGNRFVDEGAYYILVCEQMIAKSSASSYCIFDSQTLKKALELTPKGIEATRTLALGLDPRDMDKAVKAGAVWKGETVGELARNIGIDASTLEKTVAAYNGNAQAGKDTEFNRRKGLAPIVTPPYYAFKVNVGLVCHNGGLKINPNAQVLNSYGEVIPKLYAAGRDTAGIFGERYPASGAALIDLVTFGRIAGRNAAKELSAKK